MQEAESMTNPSPAREEETSHALPATPRRGLPSSSLKLKGMLSDLLQQAKLECSSNRSGSRRDDQDEEEEVEEEDDDDLGGLTEETIERLCTSEYADDVLRICQKINGSGGHYAGGAGESTRGSFDMSSTPGTGKGTTLFSPYGGIDGRSRRSSIINSSSYNSRSNRSSSLAKDCAKGEKGGSMEGTTAIADRDRSSSNGVTKASPSDPSPSSAPPSNPPSTPSSPSSGPALEPFSAARMTQAIEQGNVDRVRLLLVQYHRLSKPSVAINALTRRPLPNFFHLALTSRQEEVALFFLRQEGPTSAMTEAKDAQGRTSLMLAVIHNLLDVVKALVLPPLPLPSFSSPSSSFTHSPSSSLSSKPFSLLARTRQRRRSLTPLDLRAVSAHGHRATCYAAIHGHIDILNFLLTHMSGGDSKVNFISCVQSQSAPCGHALLHHAVLGNHYRMIKWLVQKGAGVNVLTKGGGCEDGNRKWSPLHCAVDAFLTLRLERASQQGRVGEAGGGGGGRAAALFKSPLSSSSMSCSSMLSPLAPPARPPSLLASFSFSSPLSTTSPSTPTRTPTRAKEGGKEEREEKALKIIRWLVEEGKADMTIRDALGRTPLDLLLGSALYQREVSGGCSSTESSPGRPGRGREGGKEGGREATSMKKVGKYLTLMQKKQRAVDAAMEELFDGENWKVG